MRKHADWMTIADERILEFLRDEGARQPKQIATELEGKGMEFSDKYVGRRCRKLEDNGFLQNVGNGIYRLTEQGEQYLDEEFDASDL